MEGTIGEIRLFAGNFAPRSWAFCHGQLIAINQNQALFSILGTTYGGDGRTTFGLPDLRGRVALGAGQGPGRPDYRLGSSGGSTTMTLDVNTLPTHSHPATLQAQTRPGDGTTPADGASLAAGTPVYTQGAGNPANLAGLDVGNTGNQQPFSLMQPYLGLNFIICMQGVFPSRS